MMDDLISRQAAIDALAKAMPSLTTPDGSGDIDRDIFACQEAFVDAIEVINELPSAQPTVEPRAKGHWIVLPDVIGVAYCSECNYQLTENNTNFCPNCGADMRGEEE